MLSLFKNFWLTLVISMIVSFIVGMAMPVEFPIILSLLIGGGIGLFFYCLYVKANENE